MGVISLARAPGWRPEAVVEPSSSRSILRLGRGFGGSSGGVAVGGAVVAAGRGVVVGDSGLRPCTPGVSKGSEREADAGASAGAAVGGGVAAAGAGVAGPAG